MSPVDLPLRRLPRQLWRVHKDSYGPLNPPVRSGTPQQGWSRFDIPGHATLYAASTAYGAYTEALAWADPEPFDLTDLFPDDDPAAPAASITDDWAALGHMLRGQVARQWRDTRKLTVLEPREDRAPAIVDMLDSRTLRFLSATVDEWAPASRSAALALLRLDDLTGPDRATTCAAAAHIARQVLPWGARPDGVTFASRYGTDLRCFALWAQPTSTDPHSAQAVLASSYQIASTSVIEESDDALAEAAKNLKVRVF